MSAVNANGFAILPSAKSAIEREYICKGQTEVLMVDRAVIINQKEMDQMVKEKGLENKKV